MVAKFPGTPGPPSTDVRRWRNCSGPPRSATQFIHCFHYAMWYTYILWTRWKSFSFFFKKCCTNVARTEIMNSWWNFSFFFLLFKEIIIKWCQFKIYTQRVLIYSRDNFFEKNSEKSGCGLIIQLPAIEDETFNALLHQIFFQIFKIGWMFHHECV